MADETILRLEGIGISPYAVRGLTHTLDPIQASANNRRTINGELVPLGVTQFQKYRIQITCTDQRPPVCDGVWPGRVVTVHSVAELCFYSPLDSESESESESGSASAESESEFGRPAVPGSVRREGDLIFYRPILTMLVANFTNSRDEYGASHGWTMELEEI